MKFSRKDRNAFNKSLNGLLKNSFKNINKVDKKGKTILHRAVGISNQETVKLLIEKGAEINARDRQEIAKDFRDVVIKVADQMNEMLD